MDQRRRSIGEKDAGRAAQQQYSALSIQHSALSHSASQHRSKIVILSAKPAPAARRTSAKDLYLNCHPERSAGGRAPNAVEGSAVCSRRKDPSQRPQHSIRLHRRTRRRRTCGSREQERCIASPCAVNHAHANESPDRHHGLHRDQRYAVYIRLGEANSATASEPQVLRLRRRTAAASAQDDSKKA